MSDADEREESEAKAPSSERPRKRKRKKKRRAKQEREVPTLDAAGRERPRFLLSFPRHPELDRLVAAFEAGDYATVRRDAPDLAERADDAAVRDAALELRHRLDPDPLVKYIVLASVVLLIFLVLHAYAHKN